VAPLIYTAEPQDEELLQWTGCVVPVAAAGSNEDALNVASVGVVCGRPANSEFEQVRGGSRRDIPSGICNSVAEENHANGQHSSPASTNTCAVQTNDDISISFAVYSGQTAQSEQFLTPAD
jgi:hypothetical protein